VVSRKQRLATRIAVWTTDLEWEAEEVPLGEDPEDADLWNNVKYKVSGHAWPNIKKVEVTQVHDPVTWEPRSPTKEEAKKAEEHFWGVIFNDDSFIDKWEEKVEATREGYEEWMRYGDI